MFRAFLANIQRQVYNFQSPGYGVSAQSADTITMRLEPLLNLYTCLLKMGWRWNSNLQAVNTHPTHAITPNSIWVNPPEDGRVKLDTYTDIDS
jgi:hypothetical protein